MKNKNILVIESDIELLLTLKEVLVKQECHVDTCHSSENTLKKLNARKYDLIMVDFKNSRPNEDKKILNIKKAAPKTPIIVLSDYMLQSADSFLTEHKVQAVVTKPFKIKNFLKTIQSIVKKEAVKKAIIIDDDQDVLNYMKEILKNKYEVVECTTSSQYALNKISNDHYDLIVLDLILPKMGGLELLKRIRKNKPYSPVIIFSGYVDKYSQKLCKEFGAASIIEKSSEVGSIIAAINKIDSINIV